MRLVAAVAILFVTHVVGGVNFDEIDLGGGVHLHHGTYTAQDPHITTSLQSVFSGRVAGKTVAVLLLQYELPATGYNEGAQAFEVAGGHAKALGSVGEFSYFNDSGPYPKNGWIFVSFAGGKLYADVWNAAKRCDKNHDWVSSTYTIRGDKLVRVYQLAHHRSSVPIACGEAPYVTPDPQTAHYNKAVQFDGAGHYAQAAAEWTKVLQLAPDSTDELVARAHDYVYLGQFDKAVADYNRAERLGDHDVWISWGRGLAYIYTGKPDLALADFNAAVKATQSGSSGVSYTAGALENRGELLFAMRRFGEAAQDFDAARRLDAGNQLDMLMLHLARARAGAEDAGQFEGIVAPFMGVTRPKERCGAFFFAAENELLRGDKKAARDDFLRTENICDRWAFQRYIAKAELAGIRP